MTKQGIDNKSNFSFVNNLVFFVGSRQFPHVQNTTPSAQCFEQEEHWVFEETSYGSKILHVTKVVDDSLRLLAIWVERICLLQTFDQRLFC